MVLSVSSAAANPSGSLDSYARDRIAFQARRLIRNPVFGHLDAQDLEQELAMDLIQALPKFDPTRASRKTFICRVIGRRSITLIREASRRWRQTASIEEGGADEITGDHRHHMIGYAPVDETERRERAEVVHVALKQLPRRLREIAALLMHHSPADAARILGVSQTLIGRARQQIAARFKQMGIGEILS